MAKIALKAVEEKTDKRSLCSIKMNRSMGGLEIFVKSELYEDFFHKISGGKALKYEGGILPNGEFYDVKKCSIPREDYHASINITGYGSRETIQPENEAYDFSFIKTVGIKDGIKIVQKGLLLQDDIEKFQKDFTKFTKAFFINYAKETSIEVNITTSA